ncbi:MAG: HAD family hydrolase [Prevotella sp.]|nr:HAD family hydrolase [Prevotella sp.]
MTRKTYIQPLTEIVETRFDESLMKWVSTPISDEPIEDDEFNAKPGSFFFEDEPSSPTSRSLWDDQE